MANHANRKQRAGQWILAVALFLLSTASMGVLAYLLGDMKGHEQLHKNLIISQVALVAVGMFAGLAVAAAVITSGQSRNRAVRLAGRLTAELETVARELARKNEKLEQTVQQRTGEITKKAEEALQARAALLNVLEDLTSAKHELETARAYDEALLQSMAEGVGAVDREGRITTINATAERMLNMRAQDLIGKSFTDAVMKVDEQGRPIPPEARLHTLAMQQSKPFTYRDDRNYYVRGDGTRFPVSIVAAPILKDGATIGAIATFRDITEEKQIERTKDEFVSLASHELRTPLTGIGWYAELLRDEKDGKLSPTQREYLQQILESNRRMSALVDSLLNVSRLELGTFSIEPESVDVAELVKDVLRGFVVPIEAKHLIIREEFDADIGKRLLDPRLMVIIIQNLVSNAVKYTTPSGTITLRLRQERDFLVFEVADTGIGIPNEEQNRIFKKLFRADNARLQDPEGSGLGLYMVYTLLDHIGGSIAFTSEPEVGTTFTVRLPKSGMAMQKGKQMLLHVNEPI